MPKLKNASKIRIFTVQNTGEPTDLTMTQGSSQSSKEPVITPRAGVPAMGTPEFDQYLKDWHKKHNQ